MLTIYSLTNPVEDKIRLLWDQYVADERPGQNLKLTSIPTKTFEEKLNTLFLLYMSGHESPIDAEDVEPTFGQANSVESQLDEMYAAYIDGWNPDGSGGGGGGYHADAVHTDGTVVIKTTGLSCTDNGFVSGSFWINTTEIDVAFTAFMVSDYDNDYANFIAFSPANTDGGKITIGFGNGDSYTARYTDLAAVIYDDSWHHIAFDADMNHPAGEKICLLYIDKALQTPSEIIDEGNAFQPDFNGLPFSFLDDTFDDPFKGNVAEIWFAPGQALPALDTFIDGNDKPANPSGFPASAVLFSGDAAAWMSQATAQGFTVTGSLTTPSIGPSD